jgi:DNA polymerase-3 subunit delta
MGKTLFWKDKVTFRAMLSSWDADRLSRLAERTGKLERALMFSAAPQQEALGEELLAIAREARRR